MHAVVAELTPKGVRKLKHLAFSWTRPCNGGPSCSGGEDDGAALADGFRSFGDFLRRLRGVARRCSQQEAVESGGGDGTIVVLAAGCGYGALWKLAGQMEESRLSTDVLPGCTVQRSLLGLRTVSRY